MLRGLFFTPSVNWLLKSPDELFKVFTGPKEPLKVLPPSKPTREQVWISAPQGQARNNVTLFPLQERKPSSDPFSSSTPVAKVQFKQSLSLEPGVQMHLPGNPVKADGTVDLIIQFRGVVPERFGEGDVKAVVISAETSGLSAAMMQQFGQPGFVPRMIDKAMTILRQRYGSNIQPGRLALGSFSAGYAPLAVALSNPQVRDRTDAVVVLDGIHYGKAGKPNPAGHQPFVDFAREAASGGKLMVITHSAIQPNYSSSTQAADYIMAQVGASRQPAAPVAGGYPTRYKTTVSPETRADRGGFHVEGYAGNQARSHIEQIDNLGNVWNRYLAPRWSEP